MSHSLRLAALGALALIAVSAPARADWEPIRWGMSVDEVALASGGTAQMADESPPGGYDVRLMAPSDFDGRPALAYFGFAPGNARLKAVKLVLLDQADGCAAVVDTLTRRHGIEMPRPGSTYLSPVHVWSDPETRTRIIAGAQPGGRCKITYAEAS